ncbi:alpha/beta fold hydrolase [Pelagibacterium lacus]|uniref:Alpha/beta hydrolase n=1 Tax=Pelagibacterium lacus TaxID=2282655 RepID=A0A369W7X0_9HYPH|nr:alpha/beta hydrolase [Pelagibacterium lacus]RDE10127.1 alpha/beta hydrolase [Pelagibacterium lacus]
MSGRTSRYFTLRGREIHVSQWGEPDRPALVMWHGLARTGRDFDTIAGVLCRDYFILAPDTLGRGLSQWATEPEHEYRLDNFGAMAGELLDQLGIGTCRWIGTSMGGAIGMHLAGGPLRGRISHLVINDIGPELPAAAVERIRTYAGNPPVFATVSELEAWLRTVYAPFGLLTDSEWRVMADSSARRTDAGQVTVHYDPRIVAQFAAKNDVGDQWASYDAITARTLLLRGAQSDLLSDDLAGRMQARGPRPARLDITGVGHAPALNSAEQIDSIRDFLL